jgi:hypothetical protein
MVRDDGDVGQARVENRTLVHHQRGCDLVDWPTLPSLRDGGRVNVPGDLTDSE